MLNVLIIDDEILAIEYLKKLIEWEEEGFRIAGEATSAKKALSMCKEMKVDIIITDIKMPGMDGVELAKRLKEMSCGIKVILVSAYKDFEYAKSAIEYDVSNYLLKHELTSAVLVKELIRVKQQIKREAVSKESQHKSVIRNLIYSIEDEVDKEAGTDLGEGYGFVMMMLKHNPSSNTIESDKNMDHTIALKNLMIRMKRMKLQDIYYLADLPINENHNLVVFSVKKHMSLMSVDKLIRKSVSATYELAKMEDFFALRVVTSTLIGIEEFPIVFRKLAEAIRYSVFMDFGKTYLVGMLPISPDDYSMLDNTKYTLKEKTLVDIAKMKDDEIKQWIRKQFYSVKEPFWDLKGYKKLLQYMNQIVQINNRIIFQMKDTSALMKNNKSYDDVMKAYEEEIFSCVKQMRNGSKQVYSKIVKEVISYIHKHYEEKLTLEEMGRVFELNGVYIGQLFKKEVGTTFLKYLTQHRIEISKQYLTDTRMSIGEIAEGVGYTTSQYFSQIFAKNVGLTPQAYRKWGSDRGKR